MQRTRFCLVTLALLPLASAPLLDGCSSNQTVGEEIDDATITTKVKAKLAAADNINPFDISVETEEGCVYLTGRVKEESQREEAERLALETKGVVRVVNNIAVGERA